MDSKVTFGRWEATSIIVALITTQIFLNFPRTMAETAGTASWLLTVYICVIAFVGFFLIQKLYSKFEGKDLLDIGTEVAGKYGRIILGLIILFFLGFITSVVLREFAEDMKTIAFTASPISFITFFFIICMIISAYAGIEAIARCNALIVPIIIVGYFGIIVAVLPNADFTNIFPILGTGTSQIFGSGFYKISTFSEILLLFLIIPFIKTNKNFKAVGYTAIGISSFMLILGSFIYISTFSYPSALENFLPVYQLARLINFGRFFQRVEALFVFIWASSALLYLSTMFYFIVYVFKKSFNITHHKPLIIPFGILIFAVSFIPQNLMTSINLEVFYFRNLSWVLTFAITIVLLLIARFIKKTPQKEVNT